MALSQWHTTAASNSSVGSINWAEGQSPATVNDSSRAEMADVRSFYENIEWRDWGHTPVYSSASAFTISDAASLSSIYCVNRRMKIAHSATTTYGHIESTTWVASTQTVTLKLDSGTLTSPLSSASVGPDVTNTPIHAAGVKSVARTDTANTFTGTVTFSEDVTFSNAIIGSSTSVAATTATSDIWVAGYVTLTGSTAFTITDVADAPQAGIEVEVYCNTAYTFTNSANFVIDGSASYTATQGDRIVFRAKTTSVFTLHPIKVNGKAVVETTSGRVYLDSQTATGAANISFTTGLDSTYDEYILVLTNGTVSVDDASLSFQVSTDGGSNYIGTGIYQHSMNFGVLTGTAQNQCILNDGTAGKGIGNAANETFDLRLWIHKPSGSTYKHFDWIHGYTIPAGTLLNNIGTGEAGTTTAINAIRISPSSGTFTVTGRLYGLRKS